MQASQNRSRLLDQSTLRSSRLSHDHIPDSALNRAYEYSLPTYLALLAPLESNVTAGFEFASNKAFGRGTEGTGSVTGHSELETLPSISLPFPALMRPALSRSVDASTCSGICSQDAGVSTPPAPSARLHAHSLTAATASSSGTSRSDAHAARPRAALSCPVQRPGDHSGAGWQRDKVAVRPEYPGAATVSLRRAAAGAGAADRPFLATASGSWEPGSTIVMTPYTVSTAESACMDSCSGGGPRHGVWAPGSPGNGSAAFSAVYDESSTARAQGMRARDTAASGECCDGGSSSVGGLPETCSGIFEYEGPDLHYRKHAHRAEPGGRADPEAQWQDPDTVQMHPPTRMQCMHAAHDAGQCASGAATSMRNLRAGSAGKDALIQRLQKQLDSFGDKDLFLGRFVMLGRDKRHRGGTPLVHVFHALRVSE